MGSGEGGASSSRRRGASDELPIPAEGTEPQVVRIELLGDVVPHVSADATALGASAGAADSDAPPPLAPGCPLSLAALRGRIEAWSGSDRICPLSPDLLPPRIWLRRHRGARVLAFVGGFAGQCAYAAPMVAALGLPAHLFIPLDRIGRPGHATLDQIREAGRLPGIRLEVDLASECPRSLWGRIDLLRRAAETLGSAPGRRPRYIWWGTRPLDVRARLMLRQSGYTAILCPEPKPRGSASSLPLLTVPGSYRDPTDVDPAGVALDSVALDCASLRS